MVVTTLRRSSTTDLCTAVVAGSFRYPILSGESTREPGLTGSSGLSSNCSTASAEKRKSKGPVPAGTAGWPRRRAARSPFRSAPAQLPLMSPSSTFVAELLGDFSRDNTQLFGREQPLCSIIFEICATNFRISSMCADCSRTAQQDAIIAGWNYALRLEIAASSSLCSAYIIRGIERSFSCKRRSLQLQLYRLIT